MKSSEFEAKKMALWSLGLTAGFLVLGIAIGTVWFSSAAVPAIRTIRDSAEWNSTFTMLYSIGCVFSLIYTFLMSILGSYRNYNKRRNWIANQIVTVLAGALLAVLLQEIAPTSTPEISITACILLIAQGAAIFFVSSLFAPSNWVYNPKA